jgi:hypothetical protein
MTVTRARTQRPVHHAKTTHAAKTRKTTSAKRTGRTHRTGHSTVDSFTPSARAASAARTPARTNRILDRLDVAHNPAYLPTGKRGTSSRVTHCNQFAQAALRQMGVPTPGGNANSMNSYFNRQQDGWHRVSAAEAQRMANQGHAAVASWSNPTGGHGHIAVVRPGELGAGGPRIAQAGGTNFNNGSAARGFGRHTPQYFVHD